MAGVEIPVPNLFGGESMKDPVSCFGNWRGFLLTGFGCRYTPYFRARSVWALTGSPHDPEEYDERNAPRK